MKLSQIILTSAFLAVGTVSAEANNGSAKTSPSFSTQAISSQGFNSYQLKAPEFATTKKMRVIREPLPRQNRVLRQTSSRGLVVTPHYAAGAMKIITQSNKEKMKSSMRNLYSD